ncbi:hypothetical protein [Sutterella wadsworthensis]|uniref:hypothetical protein n=1 Tax=Sutterella wadsworthensis TaxID=40545 RepID=UPI003A8F76C0
MLKSENCFPCKEVFEEEMTLAGVIPAALFCAGLSTLRAMRFVLGRLGVKTVSSETFPEKC